MPFKLLLFLLLFFRAQAQELTYGQYVFGIGMSSISFTETPVGVTGDEGVEITDPESGTVSSLVTSFETSVWGTKTKTLNLKFAIPAFSSSLGQVYSVGSSLDFFFFSMANSSGFKGPWGETINLWTKFRFSVGVELGVSYVAYITKVAEKADVTFDLGLGVNLYYNFTRKWGAKLGISVARGVGVETSTFATKMLVNATYTTF